MDTEARLEQAADDQRKLNEENEAAAREAQDDYFAEQGGENLSKVREAVDKGEDPGAGQPGGSVISSGALIFGDTDTTAGANAAGVDVPSINNEAATQAVAQAETEDADVSSDEARRQVDVSAGTTESADEVEEGAAEQDTVDADADQVDDGVDDGVAEEDLTPQQKAARTRARHRAEAEQQE